MKQHNIEMERDDFEMVHKGLRVFTMEKTGEVYESRDLINIFEVDTNRNKTGKSFTVELIHLLRRDGRNTFLVRKILQ